MAPPSLSRSLLTPGPLPPLSHLGVTLLRHAVGSGLRYALYLLGLPVPEAPPVRIVRLRLYLDDVKLAALLGETPAGEEVAAALADPGGRGSLLPAARGLAAAAAFHRFRLRLPRLPRSEKPAAIPAAMPAAIPAIRAGASPRRGAELFRAELSRGLRRTNEALLADLLASLARRQRRARGEEVPPVLSRATARLLAGRQVDLHRFGPPDLLLPSWAETPDRAAAARTVPTSSPLPEADPLRGRFRETYRVFLDRLRPLYLATAAAAVARGFLDSPEDAFFFPLDLADDLAQEHKPAWLDGAVRANRAEYEGQRRAASPPERVTGPDEGTVTLGASREWERGPVLPLP